MNRILQVDSVHDYNTFVGQSDQHPLVSVIDYSEVSPILYTKSRFTLYALFLLEDHLETLEYGQSNYDYKEGTLVCVSPGQTGGSDYTGERFDRRGWALLFHPDLLQGHPLAYSIKEYSFFEYRTNEALHMTGNEYCIYISLLKQLRRTLEQTDNTFRDTITLSYIELILKFCRRFYDRQFTTRQLGNSELLSRFEKLIKNYLNSDRIATEGLPTVAYFANQLCLSANYFGDLVKKQTGRTATEYIRQAVISLIKNRLINGMSAKEVAHSLGMERPQDLNRFFLRHTGISLAEYTNQIKMYPSP